MMKSPRSSLMITIMALLALILLITTTTATTSITDPSTTPLRATLFPFLLSDTKVPITASIAVDCDENNCKKDGGLPIEVKIEVPCELPAEITSLPIKYTIYSSLSATNGVDGTGNLDRDMTPAVDTNEELNKLTRGNRVQEKPTQHRIYKATITFPLERDAVAGEHISIRVEFPTILDHLNDKSVCFLILDPVELNITHLDKSATSIFNAHFSPPGIANQGVYNTHSKLSSTLTKTKDTQQTFYTFTLNGFIDDIQTGYLVTPLTPDQVSIFLLPTGTLQSTLFDAGYKLQSCSLLNTNISSETISLKNDFFTNLNYFQLSLPKSSIKNDKPVPASPYSEGHIISDQLQFRCDFVLSIPFETTQNGQKDDDHSTAMAPFGRQNDWGFTVIFQQSLCSSLPLFSFGCATLLPFKGPIAGREGKEMLFVDLTQDIDISTQVNLARSFEQSSTRYYHNIPTTSSKLAPKNLQKEKEITITVYRSHLVYTTPLPSSILTNQTFISPRQLQYQLNLNTHSNELFVSASYSISCLDVNEKKDGPVPETYLIGSFYSPEDTTHFTTTTHLGSSNHTSYHTVANEKNESLIRSFPDDVKKGFSCVLSVQVTTEDHNGSFRRVHPFPSLIMSTSQQFRSKSSQDLLRPVTTVFEAPLPYYEDFASPFANVLESAITVDVSSAEKKKNDKNDKKNNSNDLSDNIRGAFHFEQLYTFSFQLTNADSYRTVTSTTLDLIHADNNFDSQWVFDYLESSPYSCTIEYKNVEAFTIPKITVVSPTTIHLEGFELPHNEMALVECPGLQFGLLTSESSAVNTTLTSSLNKSQPLLAITTSNDRYTGYLLGTDAVNEIISPKTKKTIKFVAIFAIPIAVVLIGVLVFYCCFNKKPVLKTQQEETLLNDMSGYQAPNQF